LKTIVFAAGGTAGHVFMAVGIAQHLKMPKILITDERGAKHAGKAFDKVYTLPIKSKGLNFNIIKSFRITYEIFKENDSVFFGCGAYTSLIVGLTALLFRKPMFIYQGDQKIGRANKILQWFCIKCFVSTEYLDSLYYLNIFILLVWLKLLFTFLYGFGLYESLQFGIILSIFYLWLLRAKTWENPNLQFLFLKSMRDTKVVGVISRREIIDTPLPEGKFCILVLGSSLGSPIFGRIMPKILEKMPADLLDRLHIVQQKSKQCNLEETYKKIQISSEFYDFVDTIQELPKAHLVIARAGWGTIADLVTAKRASILIPWEGALDNHQVANAIAMGDLDWVFPENEKPEVLADFIQHIMRDFHKFSYKSTLFKRSQYFKGPKPGGGKRVAEYLNQQFFVVK
jgi:UDP-N-acetylglucosamine:LPS N-acetylglucosamine transferase